MSSFRRSLDRSAAAVGLLTVIAANFVYLAGLPQILDPMLSMEPLYLRMAQRPVADIVRWEAAWGPLYALWLKPIVAIFEDPVVAYMANVYALSLGISTMIYFHILLLSRRAAPAAGAALLFLISDLNVPLASKVSGFALMVALAGLTLAQLVASKSSKIAVGAGGVLLASYARPELYPAAMCLGAAALWLAYIESSSDRRGFVAPLLLVACGLLLALSIGVPTYGSDRFLIAFREHFAWNWSKWHGEGLTFTAIWQREFGDAHSILQALSINPGVVARHLFDNLAGTARFMVVDTFDHYPLLAPVTRTTLVKLEGLSLAAGAFGCLGYVATRRELRRQMCVCHGWVLFSYAVVALFCLGSATVIFPAAHYLMIPAVLLIAAVTLAAGAILPARFEYSWRWRAGAALLCLIAVPKPFVLPSAYEVAGARFKGRITVERKVFDTIALIRSLSLAPPVSVITTTDGIGEMLGTGFREVKVWQKGAQPLRDFMRDNDVGVVVNLEGGRMSFMVNDSHWSTLHDNPGAAGFVRVPVPNHDGVHVYVRADLMQRQ